MLGAEVELRRGHGEILHTGRTPDALRVCRDRKKKKHDNNEFCSFHEAQKSLRDKNCLNEIYGEINHRGTEKTMSGDSSITSLSLARRVCGSDVLRMEPIRWV